LGVLAAKLLRKRLADDLYLAKRQLEATALSQPQVTPEISGEEI
jgi:hypothetical protein